ncbi:MAG: hypothetical protein AB1638_03905 [Nitrospirota bacterium]
MVYLKMHLIVSWRIKPSGKRFTEIDDAMRLGLDGYSWIQPLSGFYIIEIFSRLDWNVIQERLLSIAQNFSGEVNFLMSPVYDAETDYFVYHIRDDDFYRGYN